MVQFEKSEGLSKANPYLSQTPNIAVVGDFEKAIDQYLKSLINSEIVAKQETVEKATIIFEQTIPSEKKSIDYSAVPPKVQKFNTLPFAT